MATTFKTFLESASSLNTLDGIAATVHAKCGDYLSHTSAGQILYRGIKNHPDEYLAHIIGPRTNRVPRDSSDNADTIFNYLGEHFLGIKNWRRNAYFCAANVRETRPYGTPFLIYPIGDTTWSWSAQYYDLTDTFRMNVKALAAEHFQHQYFDAWSWIGSVAQAIRDNRLDLLPESDERMLKLVGDDMRSAYTVSPHPVKSMFERLGAELIASNGGGYIAIDLSKATLGEYPEIDALAGPISEAIHVASVIDEYIRSH